MKLTNRWRLPDTLVNLAERDPYSKGKADFSVTQLIDSPKISVLKEKHDAEITRDITDNMWALVGRALHNVCEGGAEDHHIIEERLFMLVNDKVISGAIDVQEELPGGWVNIYDYKFTSVWSVMHQKIEWERQLNCYAQLIRSCKGKEVNSIYIVAILRDWNRHKVGVVRGYPEAPVQVVKLDLWASVEAMEYLRERVDVHSSALEKDNTGKSLPPCSDEDRWKRASEWAVHKVTSEGDIAPRATRVFKDKATAVKFLRDNSGGKVNVGGSALLFKLIERPGRYVRCEDNWCMVREWCDQWKELQKERWNEGGRK
jgi:hypothetical protein